LCLGGQISGFSLSFLRPRGTRNPLCYDSRLVALRLKRLLCRVDRVPACRTHLLTHPNLTALNLTALNLTAKAQRREEKHAKKTVCT
jgi:hypothetical protein